MKGKVYILYSNFYSRDGKQITIGGIQTYILNLCKVVKEIGKKPIIMQLANKPFETIYKDIPVIGVFNSSTPKNKKKALFNKCLEMYDKEKDIIIFASDDVSVKNNEKNVISIQHGIFWDVSRHLEYSNIQNRFYFLVRSFEAFRTINRVSRCSLLVCVDYNFQNWYRTQLAYPEVSTVVIPNFTRIPQYVSREEKEISIIFARRFFEYRGTRIFANAIEKILDNYSKVSVTFAGEGPDEEYLKKKFLKNKNVTFTKYESNESIEVHQQFNIAVVPTTGSEGTSLSLLEAMAAGCAVVSTDVGGLTNIILNNYNGLLIPPEEISLYNAIESLITNPELMNKLSKNAYESVKNSFDLTSWKNKWKEIFLSF